MLGPGVHTGEPECVELPHRKVARRNALFSTLGSGCFLGVVLGYWVLSHIWLGGVPWPILLAIVVVGIADGAVFLLSLVLGLGKDGFPDRICVASEGLTLLSLPQIRRRPESRVSVPWSSVTVSPMNGRGRPGVLVVLERAGVGGNAAKIWVPARSAGPLLAAYAVRDDSQA